MIPGTRTSRRAVAMAVAVASLWLAAPAVCAAATAPERPALPADLARAVQTYNEATASSDTRTLAGLMTDDYVLVNSDASVQDKASYLADFAAPGFKLEPYVVEPLTYQVRGPAALTAWTFRLSWTQDGRHQTRRLRLSHFWVNHDGRWQIAFTQLTRVPE